MSFLDKIRLIYSGNTSTLNPNQQSITLTGNSTQTIPAHLQQLQNNINSQSGNSSLGQTIVSGTSNSSTFLPGLFTNKPSLSQEEQLEMASLEAEIEIYKKKSKLEYFKRLPKDFRQFVINSAMWSNIRKEMDNISEPISEPYMQRLQELRNKNPHYAGNFWGSGGAAGGSGGGNSFSGYHSQFYPYDSPHMTTEFPLPKDISLQELTEAHMDAMMEEELVNE